MTCDHAGKRCKPTTPTGLPHVQRCSALPDKSAAVVSGEGVHYISRFGIANRQITQKTDPGIALYDITPKVQAILSECGLKEGCINLFVPNTTAALAVNEYEPRLLEDLKIFLRYWHFYLYYTHCSHPECYIDGRDRNSLV